MFWNILAGLFPHAFPATLKPRLRGTTNTLFEQTLGQNVKHSVTTGETPRSSDSAIRDQLAKPRITTSRRLVHADLKENDRESDGRFGDPNGPIPDALCGLTDDLC